MGKGKEAGNCREIRQWTVAGVQAVKLVSLSLCDACLSLSCFVRLCLSQQVRLARIMIICPGFLDDETFNTDG